MRVLVASLLVAGVLTTRVACAEGSGSAAPAAAQPEEKRWYGWQLLLADAGALALVGTTAATGQPAFVYLAVPSYLVTPLVIHGVHGHSGAAAISFVLRVAAPALFGAIGYALAVPRTSSCPAHEPMGSEGASGGGGLGQWCLGDFTGIGGAVVGAGIGALTASLIDAAGLGFEPTKGAPAAGVPPFR